MSGTTSLLTLADHWDGDHMGSASWWWWMPIVMILVIGLIVAGVAVAARSVRPSTDVTAAGSRRAGSIAAERYARGEITAAEYDEIRTRLE